MKSAVAVLTFRRLHSLREMLSGLEVHCPIYRTAVFEDCGQRDSTADYLQQGRKSEKRPELMATEYVVDNPLDANHPNVQVFMGDRNLGVAGNSNRAIKWFMDTGLDHLCLCNDDLHVLGDFVKFHGQAHADLDVQLFCFCDFTHHESYKWTVYPWRGYRMKFLPRFTGIMMSMTRPLLEKVGYFDAEFGKFGEEHSDFTIRSRIAGGIQMDGQSMNCLDIEHSLLKHQEVETSVRGQVRARADEEARRIMERCTHEYQYRHYYRPFRLTYPAFANGYYGSGVPCRQLEQIGYKIVSDLV